jgi:hypothetical protein
VHITYSFTRDGRTRQRDGRLVCVGDFIYLTAWPREGANQLIHGILRNQPAPETPYDGWMIYPSSVADQDTVATAIIRTRIRLSQVPRFGGQAAETQRRKYIADRTGLLPRPLDEDVRKFFSNDIAAS